MDLIEFAIALCNPIAERWCAVFNPAGTAECRRWPVSLEVILHHGDGCQMAITLRENADNNRKLEMARSIVDTAHRRIHSVPTLWYYNAAEVQAAFVPELDKLGDDYRFCVDHHLI